MTSGSRSTTLTPSATTAVLRTLGENYYGQTDIQPTGDTPSKQPPVQQRPDRFRAQAADALRKGIDAQRGDAACAQGDLNAGRSEQAGDRGRQPAIPATQALQGAPVIREASGPDAGIVAVAWVSAFARNVDLKRQGNYAKVDPELTGGGNPRSSGDQEVIGCRCRSHSMAFAVD